MLGLILKWAVLILGGMVGNYIASAYLIRGESEGDNRGFVTADPSTPWGADDAVRVLAILAGAKAASKILSKVRGGK